MLKPTISKLPEVVIFGGPLPKSRFSAISANAFHANLITGNIWPRVDEQLWHAAGKLQAKRKSYHWYEIKPMLGDIYNWVESQKSKFQVWRPPRLFSSLMQGKAMWNKIVKSALFFFVQSYNKTKVVPES